MKSPPLLHLIALPLALLCASPAFADRLELTDGSVILGRIVSAEAGTFKIETTFAGTLEIAQDKIVHFTTDDAVNLRLAGGSNVQGRIRPAAAGIAVADASGLLSAPTADIIAVWPLGADSPETRKLKELAAEQERKWALEASVALAGRSGVSEKFGANLGFKATLANAQDKLIFTAATERASDNGVETANRDFGGVDYSAFYAGKNGWYARTSLEQDVIKALNLRTSTAFGLDRRLIQRPQQDLEFRFGLNYLSETYADHTRFGSVGLDLALLHAFTFRHSKLINNLSYTPAFREFANYRVHHDSSLEFPLVASLWRLKFGVANDYQSKPPAGTERLDTTYFTSLLLNWQ